MDAPFVVHGVCFDQPEISQDREALTEAYRSRQSFVWIDIFAHDIPATRKFLEAEFRFHPLEVEDALSDQERPALRADETDIFLVAPAVVLGQSTERFVEVSFFVDAFSVVTVTTHPAPLLDSWRERCLRRPDAHTDSIKLLHSLLDEIVDGYFPAVDLLSDDIDDLEDQLYLGAHIDIGHALAFKRRLLEMRRNLVPIRDILNQLLRRDFAFMDAEDRKYFQDVYDHTLRILEDIDLQRDLLSSVLDAQVSITSNRLNEVMRRLTVISTVLMTGAFVAGVYGMNFANMPELHWTLGYPFSIGLMVILGALEVWWFRRKGYL